MGIWGLLLTALGLALFLEGLPYFISPRTVRAHLRRIDQMSDGALRTVGLALMIFGLVVAFLTTR